MRALWNVIAVAVANTEPLAERLEMGVGSAGFDGAGDNPADKADRRRPEREVLQGFGVITGLPD